jgi:hypothetical protein
MVTVYVIVYSQAVRNKVCECQKIGGCGKMERFRAGENVFTFLEEK